MPERLDELSDETILSKPVDELARLTALQVKDIGTAMNGYVPKQCEAMKWKMRALWTLNIAIGLFLLGRVLSLV